MQAEEERSSGALRGRETHPQQESAEGCGRHPRQGHPDDQLLLPLAQQVGHEHQAGHRVRVQAPRLQPILDGQPGGEQLRQPGQAHPLPGRRAESVQGLGTDLPSAAPPLPSHSMIFMRLILRSAGRATQ